MLPPFDCNADGFADLLLAGGTAPAKFYRNASRQGGALKFEAFESGLEIDKVAGTYPVDIDSDGNVDIVLLRVGENIVMRGLGECRFERANEAWGFDGGDAWSAAYAATWERGANWPTIAIGNYIDREEEAFPWGSCTDNWLHRPGDPGRFAPPLALEPSHCALSMLFTDWDRSGTPCASCFQRPRILQGRTGTALAHRAGPGLRCFSPKAKAGSPCASGAWASPAMTSISTVIPEYFHTSMADNKLQKLARFGPASSQSRLYQDIAWARGVTAHRPFIGEDLKPSTAWHTQFEDFNNDARADLFIAKGNVAKMPDFAARDPNNLLLQGFDGKFVEAADKAGVASGAISRGGAVADFNMDGLPDLVVVNRWENAQLWRNVTTDAGRFLSVALVAGRPEPRCHRRLDRGQARIVDPAARGFFRRGPCQRTERLVAFRAWEFRQGRSPRYLARWKSGRLANSLKRAIFMCWSAASLPACGHCVPGRRTPRPPHWTIGKRADKSARVNLGLTLGQKPGKRATSQFMHPLPDGIIPRVTVDGRLRKPERCLRV